jgi:membrane protein
MSNQDGTMAQTTASKGGELFSLLKEAAQEWQRDKTTRLGAALAYYAVFSLAPMMIVLISVAGLIYGEKAARGELVVQIQNAVGPTVAEAVQANLTYIHVSDAGTWAALIGVVMALFTASWVFAQLQDSLNTIWDVKARDDRSWLDVIRERAGPFLMVLVGGALLLSLMVLNSLLAAAQRMLPEFTVPGGTYLWRLFELTITLGVTTLLCALLYKVLPDVSLEWKDVWVGAVVTAVLFLIGNWLIGMYIRWSEMPAVYGAAGSLVVVLLWVYYSSQVFLFGAELTHTYAKRDRTPRVVKRCAEPLAPEDRAHQGMPARPSSPASAPC